MGKSKPLVAGGTEIPHTTIATDPGMARSEYELGGGLGLLSHRTSSLLQSNARTPGILVVTLVYQALLSFSMASMPSTSHKLDPTPLDRSGSQQSLLLSNCRHSCCRNSRTVDFSVRDVVGFVDAMLIGF